MSVNKASANLLRSATTVINIGSATAPSANQVLTATSSTAATWQTPSGSTDGWITVSDTWTYASPSTFTISGVDRTGVYTKGTRLKFTQTTDKYAIVVSSSFSTDTTVTIAVNTNYTIANAAITSPYYSYQLNPSGYPEWFDFTTTWGGFSGNPTPSTIRYSVQGRQCLVYFTATGNGTSNSTSLTATLPFVATTTMSVYCIGRAVDNGSSQTTPPLVKLTATSATATFHKDMIESNWTSSGAKSINFNFIYEI